MGKPFDLLAEFGKFGLERRMSLRDPATISAFIGHVGDRVEGALGDSPLLYGQRTEAMFEAFLVSLGEFELLKGEDSGRLFPDVRYRVPDFRVVLKDGSHWLIEVKNVYEPDPLQQRRRVFSASHLGQTHCLRRCNRCRIEDSGFLGSLADMDIGITLPSHRGRRRIES